MRAVGLIGLCLLAVGCFSPKYANGKLQCEAGSKCPDGYHCAFGNTCWKNGSDPVVKQQGDACADGDLCATGHCVDGFCCESACDSTCSRCDETPGSCTVVTGMPAGARTCNGQGGLCGGLCDGSGPDCVYPPAITRCGSACDGTCDGAGNCSSGGGGGTCAGGYACGLNGCLTSCNGAADCQVNFECTNHQCTRVPESDCLDGKDNNGDGLADCQDPTCNAQVSCVPSGPGGSQIGVVNATCPTGFGPGTAEKTSFQDTTCGGCGCATTPQCSLRVDMRGASGCGGTYYPITITGPANGQLSPCTAVDGAYYVQMYVFQAATASRTCAVTGTPSRADPSFSVSTSFCPAQRTSSTCAGANEVCAPTPPMSTKVCVAMPGSVTCPAGYTTTGPTYYYQGASKGNCGSCPGSCTPGSSPSCYYDTDVYDYTAASCGGTQYGAGHHDACFTQAAGGNIYGAKAVFYPDGAAESCSVGQPATTPSTLIGQTTICCK